MRRDIESFVKQNHIPTLVYGASLKALEKRLLETETLHFLCYGSVTQGNNFQKMQPSFRHAPTLLFGESRNKNPALFAITSTRILSLYRILGHEDVEQIAFQNITGFENQKGPIFGVLKLYSTLTTFEIDLSLKLSDCAMLALDAALLSFNEAATKAVPCESAGPSFVADEILKLKQLLDAGILTHEEFNAKKKQLLGV